MNILKTIMILAVFLETTCKILNAQTPPTSAEEIRGILTIPENRSELKRLKSGITVLLSDQRLNDNVTCKMLTDSQAVLNEMLDQKIGANAGILVNFATWLREQEKEKHAIQDAGGVASPQQQFVLENSLAGGEIYLTSLLNGILGTYLEIDGESAGQIHLEALLQLYLRFRVVLERSWWLADNFLFRAPQWIQSRYLELTTDQKRQFLKDVNDARAEKAAGPGADEEPVPPPTSQEVEAYESAYRFIVNNTPPP